MKVANFAGFNFWSYPTFKLGKRYFCIIDPIPDNASIQEIVDAVNNEKKYNVYYVGTDPDDDPRSPVEGIILSAEKDPEAA